MKQNHRGKVTLNDTSFSRETEQTVAADMAAAAKVEPGTVTPKDRLMETSIETDQHDHAKLYVRKGSPNQ